MLTVKNKNIRSRTGGFTIVELLVAATILLVAVIAVVAMVRKSSEMQINDFHRRQARAVAMGYFETVFAYENSDMTYAITGGNPSTLTLAGVSSQSSTVSNIVIDDRARRGNDTLKGTMIITVSHDSLANTSPAWKIGRNTAKILLWWREPWGNDTITMSKQMLTEKL
ncbi:MAG: prepilin-type N-terminal cleavage/methylation domain-containing protein [Chitinispirillia bacterium]|nr:prepilin-type N-terminal cleavage/methylation domain-containing protein [Chitinispirillia bacterium]MCL2241698.1 prepilin-type N-terminal cleavage/methylation domain-containing protein [Chitinispirillia bacterium]